VYIERKPRRTEESTRSEIGGSLFEVAGDVLSELIPDSFSLFTALIFCTAVLIAVLVWAVRFFVQD